MEMKRFVRQAPDESARLVAGSHSAKQLGILRTLRRLLGVCMRKGGCGVARGWDSECSHQLQFRPGKYRRAFARYSLLILGCPVT